jgi:dinuclear metal center YbgI/SA1388 family protein
MIKRQELCHYLDQLFSSNGEVDYGPNGLQVEGKEQIQTVATAVSASLATIEAAIKAQADALIVHHGLFWYKDSFVIQGTKKKKISLLLEHGISLIAYHLPLDHHPQLGNNWKAAEEMGWKNLQPFGWMNKIMIGVKGEIPPCSQEKFKNQLETYYQHSAFCALGGPTAIRKVALISGGAYKSITEAVQSQMDAFVTGSFDEPVWHQAFEEKINFFALGHSATEKVGPKAICQHLKEELKLPSLFLDVFNPF